MRLPWLTEDQKFAFGATIIFIGAAIVLSLLTGCASVFDTPQPATPYVRTDSSETVLCQYIHEAYGRSDIWLMRVPRKNCPNWTPI